MELDKSVVYLDHAATTPCRSQVVAAMLPYFTTHFGNASSVSHEAGREARRAVELARRQVATLVGAKPTEIVFTSGTTESNNLAIKGIASRIWKSSGDDQAPPYHVVTTAVEHSSVLGPIAVLERLGFEVSVLRPRPFGSVLPGIVEAALRDNTVLVSAMWANNEVGTLADVRRIGELCRQRGVVYHCDAAQAVGKLPMALSELPIDLMSWGAHKLGGPLGVGALFVSDTLGMRKPEALLHGGGQEHGLRSGTLNLPAIVGFGVASQLAFEEIDVAPRIAAALRDSLERAIMAKVPGVRVNGDPINRAPHISSLTFSIRRGCDFLEKVVGISCSSGSACASAERAPSHVLRALGFEPHEARSTLRLSVSSHTSEQDIALAAMRISEAAQRWNGDG